MPSDAALGVACSARLELLQLRSLPYFSWKLFVSSTQIAFVDKQAFTLVFLVEVEVSMTTVPVQCRYFFLRRDRYDGTIDE